MIRLLASLFAIAIFVLAAPAAEKASILGKVQPEIRLTDGTVFKKAKIVEFSIEKSTATIAEPTRIRTVALDTLPPKLRDQILTETGVKTADPRQQPPRSTPRPVRPYTPAGGTATGGTEAPTASTSTPLPREQLLQQAATTAPKQLSAHLTRTYGLVSHVSTKVLETGEIPGWPKIRVTGETSFSERAPGQRDSTTRKEKFEIEYSVANGVLQPETITVGGISRPVTP